jgi:hypothetical protein
VPVRGGEKVLEKRGRGGRDERRKSEFGSDMCRGVGGRIVNICIAA